MELMWKIVTIIALILSVWSAWASWQNTAAIGKTHLSLDKLIEVVDSLVNKLTRR